MNLGTNNINWPNKYESDGCPKYKDDKQLLTVPYKFGKLWDEP